MATLRVCGLLGLFFLAACPAADGDRTSDAGAPTKLGAAGNGADAALVGSGGSSGNSPGETTAPGTAISDPNTRGPDVCANTTLGDVIAAVHARWPMLADITVKDVLGTGGVFVGDAERRIFAFMDDKGFALVFKRGNGDCPAGCLDNEYWYFRTGASCAPELVGHYHAGYQSPGNCVAVAGAPMWGLPRAAPDPSVVCGADNRAQDISGT